MRIFFLGTVDFSRAMLTCLLEIEEVEIVGVGTKSKSNFNSDHTDLSDIAKSKGIPFKYIKDVNQPHIVKWIQILHPDVIYCMGWSSLIKSELLKLCPLGVIGFHPALLPQNRGRHPLIWALVLGLKKTGTTFFKMNEGPDSGDILSQESFTIEGEDTAADLYKKMINSAARQVKCFTPKLATGDFELKKQNETLANHWRKRGKEDGRIDFRMSSQSIYNLVRALTIPYVGAHFDYLGKEYKVWKVELGPAQESNLEPGQILAIDPDNQLLVKTGDGSIWIRNHELDQIPDISEYLL